MVPSQKFNYSIVNNWLLNITLNLAERTDHVTAETQNSFTVWQRLASYSLEFKLQHCYECH